MVGQIPKQVLQNLKQVAVETGKEVVGEVGKITESVITGKELLGGLTNLSPEQLAQKKAEDEKKKQEEMARLRQEDSGGRGRNVEGEMKEIRDEEKKKKEEEERVFLENIRRQREAEAAERAALEAQMGESSGHAKRKGPAIPGKKKKSMPDPSQMSQTSEFKGKID